MNGNTLDNLNGVQREAASHMDGPLLILAGAGSGKTSVLTHRTAFLIEQGVMPFQILAITFTNKAAREMRERVNRLADRGAEVWVSTFHSMCVRILRKHAGRLSFESSFTIYDTDDSERLMKACVKTLNINDKQFPPAAVLRAVSAWKNELLTPAGAEAATAGDFRAAQMCRAYRLYQQRLRENNALDFDDLIFKTVELFETCPDVLEQYHARFAYIMVDEYQDTNTAQYRLTKLLAGENGNLCVVGDDDQSIYGWRGANIRNILDFEKDNKNCKVVKLEQNYRSTQVILDAANSVISNNTRRKGKALWTDKGRGAPIYYFKAAYDYEEGLFVAERIAEAVKNGAKYADHAVLYRGNAQSRAIEEQLVARNVPYRLFGGVRFYERKEVKDVLAYLRVINNPRDGVSLLRILNVPRRGIGDSTVDKLNEYAAANDMPLFGALQSLECIESLGTRGKRLEEFRELMLSFMEYAKDHTVTELMNRVLSDTGYVGDLMVECTEEAMGRIENIEELLSKAAEFEEHSEDKRLTAFLEELALVADIDNYSENDDTVSLMTLHSAKGLEFPCVFMVGMEEGLFPSYRSTTSGDLGDLEEERRICYVGITRARQTLYITAAASRRLHGQVVYNAPSRFLKEIPEELMEHTSLPSDKPDQPDKKEKRERTGISQFAEVNKVKNAIDISFGGKNYAKPEAVAPPKNGAPDFNVGDSVRQMKYGVGVVVEIRSAGADYEVTVDFKNVGVKKIMARLSKLRKIES